MARTYLIPFVLLFFLKTVLAAVFPVFGDEAYYVYWGSNPSGGFYDLPPMIGWWLAPLLKVSGHPLWIRMGSLLAPVLISFGIQEWLSKPKGREISSLGALLFFALPLPFLTVLSFPDVPLLFFSFFSALLFHAGVTRQKNFFSPVLMMAGSLFGAAFLSKYFAAFLLPAFILWAWPRSAHRAGAVLSFFAGAAPFLFQHLLWNERNCRANAIFNLVTRQRVFEGSPVETTGFLLLHLALVSFTVLPFLKWRKGRGGERSSDPQSFFFLLWFVPVLIFLITAVLGRGQGLHWLLFLTPFFSAWAACKLERVRLRRAFLLSAFVAATLASVVSVSFLMPERFVHPEVKQRFPFEFGVITGAPEFVPQIEAQTEGSSALLFQSYGLASLVHYEFLRFGNPGRTPAFGVAMSGSRFGRVFDFTTDWAELEGKTVSIIKTGDPESAKFAPYFRSVKEGRYFFRGAAYSVLTGEGFDARKFWGERVLPELEEFYPSGFAGACRLKEVFRAP